MATYTVHAPPPRGNKSAADPERFVFVRDGFYVWAFLLTPLWLLLRRLWLVLVLYLVVTGVIGAYFKLTGASAAAEFLVSLLIALLVGLEAGSLWRWTLARRGWKMRGFVVADGREAAERRFFAEWCQHQAAISPPPLPTSRVAMPVSRETGDVIGLFPQPRGTQ